MTSRPLHLVPPAGGGLLVRPIEPALHAAFAREHRAGARSVVHRIGTGWTAEDIGWFHDRVLAGTALLIYRPVRGSRRRLAYLPEGPLLPWTAVGTAPERAGCIRWSST